MPHSNAIEATVFCRNHKIDYEFIEILQQNGLIQTSIESGNLLIPEEELPQLEKIIRLHFDLNINLEGIEVVNYLLHKIENMQQQLVQLENQVALYESILPGAIID